MSKAKDKYYELKAMFKTNGILLTPCIDDYIKELEQDLKEKEDFWYGTHLLNEDLIKENKKLEQQKEEMLKIFFQLHEFGAGVKNGEH